MGFASGRAQMRTAHTACAAGSGRGRGRGRMQLVGEGAGRVQGEYLSSVVFY